MSAAISPLHPEDAAEEWARATLIARQLLLLIDEAHEDLREDWSDRLGAVLVGDPAELLLAVAHQLDDAGALIAHRVGLWSARCEAVPASERIEANA